jgi:hypothetical protein
LSRPHGVGWTDGVFLEPGVLGASRG